MAQKSNHWPAPHTQKGNDEPTSQVNRYRTYANQCISPPRHEGEGDGGRGQLPKLILIWIASLVLLAFTGRASAQEVPLTVAWNESADLFIWQAGSASVVQLTLGDLNRLFIAPDAQHIAFTRGSDERLWLVSTNGDGLREWLAPQALEGRLIAQVAWLDSTTLYFNTAQKTDIGQLRQDDLWRADLITGEVKQLLAPGDGGDFTLSPDAQRIALTQPGAYGAAAGQVSLVDPLGGSQQVALNFPAVSTGSEYHFYPLVSWQPDSSAFTIVIPDPDLIYADSSALTRLGRITRDGEYQSIGSLQASFFGQPRWSSGGEWMTYIRRVAEGNQLELVVASGDGTNNIVYASGEAGALQPARWLPGTDRFVYAQGEPGQYWLGAPGEFPHSLGEMIVDLRFVSPETYVYSTPAGGGVELRYASLTQPETSTVISAPGLNIPYFDAVGR